LGDRKWEDYNNYGLYFKGWGDGYLVPSRYYIQIPKHLNIKYMTNLLNSKDSSDHNIFKELVKIVE